MRLLIDPNLEEPDRDGQCFTTVRKHIQVYFIIDRKCKLGESVFSIRPVLCQAVNLLVEQGYLLAQFADAA